MTEWQWKVIMALVRMFLRGRNVDLPSLYDEYCEEEDESILIEAHIRSRD